ncbi:Cys-tRNA(Pro) deacylase, partial [Limosilactobacillus reuteri]
QGDIFVSSGKVGRSIKLNAEDLATLVHATFADLEQK